MLIEFTVGNFRSFKEPVTLSMVAAKLKARDPRVNENNTIPISEDLTLLTSAVIYGANASGKSNLVQALAFMRAFVLTSANELRTAEPITVEPFRLSTETEQEPSFFEIVFILDDIQYRYGFEVNTSQVVSEWLFAVLNVREVALFVREGDKIKSSLKYFKEGKGLDVRTRPKALFLSLVALLNGETAQSILGWFRRIGMVSGLDDTAYRTYTIKQVVDGQYKDAIIRLVKSLDIDIDDIQGIKLEKDKISLSSSTPQELRALFIKSLHDGEVFTVQTKHSKLDAQGKAVDSVTFDMDLNESHGTQKAFYLAGPIVDVLSQGKVLIVDEMEARLHPLVTRELIGLFNSQETNPKQAQIIFTTHDTNLLSNKLFRRDQIWFIEKDSLYASHLYSLAEIKVDESKIRNDASFEDGYLQGRYGGIPFIGKMQTIVLAESADEQS